MNHNLPYETVVVISVFLVGFLFFLHRRLARNRIDLHDFLLLSAVAVFPALLAFFPNTFVRVCQLIGVELPLVLLFGMLFAVVFLYLTRVVIKLNETHKKMTIIAQELALLRQEGRQSGEPADG